MRSEDEPQQDDRCMTTLREQLYKYVNKECAGVSPVQNT